MDIEDMLALNALNASTRLPWAKLLLMIMSYGLSHNKTLSASDYQFN